MKAKNVQLAFAIALLGVIGFATFRALFPVHRSLDPRWKDFAAFIRQADRVEIVATDYGSFPYLKPPDSPEQFLNRVNRSGQNKIQTCDQAKREQILKLIADSTTQEGSASSCFSPHHYVIARKGSQQVVLSLCYQCHWCSVEGAIKITDTLSPSAVQEATNVFGVDLKLDIPKDRTFNPG